MKIYFKRVFKYTLDGRTVHKILPGTYEVPRQVEAEAAKCALELGQAVIVPEPKVDDMTYGEMQTKAGKLDIPATGTTVDLKERIEEAEEKPKTAKKKAKVEKKAPENKVLKVKRTK